MAGTFTDGLKDFAGRNLNAAGDLAGDVFGGVSDAVASSAWGAIVRQFSDAAFGLIESFISAWPDISRVGFDGEGIEGIYDLCTVLGALVAVLVLLIAVVRTQLAADGRYVTAALVGLAKAALAIAVTVTVTQTGASLSGGICDWIVTETHGDAQNFLDRARQVTVQQPNTALTLVFALVSIVTLLVLWAEILLVKLAIAALVATSPIGASGLLSEATSVWWQRQAMATFRLLLVPPSITLCFALGFKEAETAEGLTSNIVALMTLAAAVLCWPALARFFAIDVDGQVSGGLGLLLGAASNLGSRFSGMGNQSAGNPLDPVALQRAGGAGQASSGGGLSAAGAGFLPIAATAAMAAVGGFQRGMGRTAAHAGLGGIGESPDTPWLRGGRGGGRSRPAAPSRPGGGGDMPSPAPSPALSPAPVPPPSAPDGAGGGGLAAAADPGVIEGPLVPDGPMISRPGDGLPIARPPSTRPEPSGPVVPPVEPEQVPDGRPPVRPVVPLPIGQRSGSGPAGRHGK
ncbi:MULTISPECIES: hypothetical protein [Parafrankia]|uniref:hypothetical protein n=1 Tax=Parafrankia TaxID=2994362 RepID=UPI0013F4CC72|nr:MULTISPECIES: hypothetical protein [Parafrankia]MBE3206669.1 hypothetical protein [Parafrankia sp. CH37]